MEIVLGVTGGIAAFKAAEIVRGLRRAGAGVTVVMTRHATEFITPLTLQTLSGRRVITSHFDLSETGADPGDVEHIGLARRCDLLLVAPATASAIGKLAGGIADDFLTTFYLAVTCPVVVAPAMNTRMWEHPAVRENVQRLASRGVVILGPETGPLATESEGTGIGRLMEPETIVSRVIQLAREAGCPDESGPVRRGSPLAGRLVLVTAGPTREALDPVRYLSNPSTGKMGFAIAAAARDLGARVVLVTGPTHLADMPGVKTLRVTSAEQMHEAVMAQVDGGEPADIVVMAAAVSDFRPTSVSGRKVKKESAALQVPLERTPDILAELAGRPGRRFVVGFAAETEDVAASARRKLAAKKLDLIVANDVSANGSMGGFGADTNEVIVIDGEGTEHRWPSMSKQDVAARLMSLVAERLP